MSNKTNIIYASPSGVSHRLLTYFGSKLAQAPAAQELNWKGPLPGLEGDISFHGTLSPDQGFLFVFPSLFSVAHWLKVEQNKAYGSDTSFRLRTSVCCVIRKIVGVLFLGVFMSRLDGALRNVVWWKVPCPWHWAWHWVIHEDPSNPHHSMIL